MSDESIPLNDADAVRREYRPNGPETLSDTVLDAVDAHEHGDISPSKFRLFDNVDPDALDHLFREDADGDLTVQFRFDNVLVSLWGDGGVEVRVTDQQGRR